LEKELKSLLWKIDYSEIMIKRSDSGYSMEADDNLGLAMEIQVETTQGVSNEFMERGMVCSNK